MRTSADKHPRSPSSLTKCTEDCPLRECFPRSERRRLIQQVYRDGIRRLPHGVPLEVLRDPRQWEDVCIPLEGELASPGEHVHVTRWVWEQIRERYSDIRPLKHGRRGKHGKGQRLYYAFPSSHLLAKQLRELGRKPNSLTLASLLNAAAGIGDWDSRSKWQNGIRFDCTIFNLTVTRFPVTPHGEDAKRSRLALELGFEDSDTEVTMRDISAPAPGSHLTRKKPNPRTGTAMGRKRKAR